MGRKRDARIIREKALQCRRTKAFHATTTNSTHSLAKYQNLCQNPEKKIMLAIAGDVTCFDIKGKNHYLPHLLDLTNREPIGLAISDLSPSTVSSRGRR